MPSRAADQIVIDTLGKLYAHGYGGYCLDCRRLFASCWNAAETAHRYA
jgi:hypothetical protein